MRRLSKLSARFIGEHGFSIGVDDVTPAQRLLLEKQATIESSYLECQVNSFDAHDLKQQHHWHCCPVRADCHSYRDTAFLVPHAAGKSISVLQNVQ